MLTGILVASHGVANIDHARRVETASVYVAPQFSS